MKLDRYNGYGPTDWAIYLDSNKYACRGIDTVDQWAKDWDAVDAPLALWSFATDTHCYVRDILITGRTVIYDKGCGTPSIRVRVNFADPDVGHIGGRLIRVGGAPFVSLDAIRYFHYLHLFL